MFDRQRLPGGCLEPCVIYKQREQARPMLSRMRPWPGPSSVACPLPSITNRIVAPQRFYFTSNNATKRANKSNIEREQNHGKSIQERGGHSVPEDFSFYFQYCVLGKYEMLVFIVTYFVDY